MRGHRHGLHIDHGNVRLVGDIYVQLTFAVAHRLFRSTAEIKRADHVPLLGIDHGSVWRATFARF